MNWIEKNLLLLLLFLNISVFGQTTISGTVADENGSRLEFANVFLKSTADGSTTDSLGRFSFTTSESGEKELVVSNIGYKNFEKTVNLNMSAVTVNVVLKTDAKQLGEVIISAGAFEASDKSRGASLTPIDNEYGKEGVGVY